MQTTRPTNRRVLIILWSIATLVIGLTNGFVAPLALRMAVGFFEVLTFSINNRIATTWFGEKERATCIAVYTAAESVGLAFLTPALFWIKTQYGWPAIFLATGTLGLFWSVIFFRTYKDPVQTKGIESLGVYSYIFVISKPKRVRG